MKMLGGSCVDLGYMLGDIDDDQGSFVVCTIRIYDESGMPSFEGNLVITGTLGCVIISCLKGILIVYLNGDPIYICITWALLRQGAEMTSLRGDFLGYRRGQAMILYVDRLTQMVESIEEGKVGELS